MLPSRNFTTDAFIYLPFSARSRLNIYLPSLDCTQPKQPNRMLGFISLFISHSLLDAIKKTTSRKALQQLFGA
jgi:hypothetical protein